MSHVVGVFSNNVTKDTKDTELAAVALQYYLVLMLFTFHSLCFLAM